MAILSSSLTTMLCHSARKCAIDVHVSLPGAGSCVLPPKGAAGVARNSFGSRGGSSRRWYQISSGVVQAQQRDFRDTIVLALFAQRKSSQKRSWRCFSEPEKTESESAPDPSNPSCCTDSTPATEVKEEAVTSGNSTPVFETYGPGKRGNQLFALASVTVAVGLFLSGRLPDSGPGLPELAAAAISYQEALSNGRPTVVEFYADWCEVCKETAHDVYEVEQEYKGQINFVMLNVDNSKWEGELDEFGVEGIPHFAFLDREGNEEGNVVGRLPRKILKENLAALARGDATVPHSRVVGKFSNADSRQAPPVVGPRSHSQMS